MGWKPRARLQSVEVAIPFGIGKAVFAPDAAEQHAAWHLYVELVTRVAVQPLPVHTGVVREALASLHSLFPTTRAILKEAGPKVGARMPSVGGIALAVLNKGLRPFLTNWHPRLSTWEAQRPEGKALVDHEENWPELSEFRGEFDELRESLEKYALALAKIAGVAD